MNTRYPPVPQLWLSQRPHFHYCAPWNECRIIHEHDCMGTRLLIVGDPDNGGYEWAILREGKVESHSNDGYGISEVALRDGLIAAFKDCFSPPVSSTPPPASASVPHAAALQDSPTTPLSPSPRALRLASSLSKPSLRMIVGFRPLPAHILASRCNTILNSRGETEPLDARDLQAAARHLWQQKGYKPHLPPLTPAPQECAESPAAPHAAQAQPAAQALHPKEGSSLHSSSAHTGEACGDINCDGKCPPPADGRPSLIIAIDACLSATAAEIAVSNACQSARRAAARYLRTDLHSLPEDITRRVRARLAQL